MNHPKSHSQNVHLRALACKLITSIIQKQSSLLDINEQLAPFQLTSADQSLIKNMCYGICRHYFQLDYLSRLFLKPKTKNQLRYLLIIGIYQLKWMKIPDHAAIYETVEACNKLKMKWAKPVINGCLQKIKQFNVASLLAQAPCYVQYNQPEWLLNKMSQQYPDNWQAIVKALNDKPPCYLRINPFKTTQQTYHQLLAEYQIVSKVLNHPPYALKLDDVTTYEFLPGFDQGYCAFQDISAQLASVILSPEPNETILDACSAPGGKTSALHHASSQTHILATELNEKRFKQMKPNIERLVNQKASIKLIHDDCQNLTRYYGKKLDKILLDAPCSGTGVLKRNPDIKIKRDQRAITEAQNKQLALLKTLWPLLKKGGLLLYCTCSLLQEENEQVISQFHAYQSNLAIQPITQLHGFTLAAFDYGYQLYPFEGDGLYYSLMMKT